MNKYVSYIIVGVASFILGFLAVKCNPNTFIDCDKMDCYTLDSTVTDTMYIPDKEIVRWDTVKVKDVNIKPSSTTSIPIDSSTSMHVAQYKDTILDATVTSYVQGIIDSQFVNYSISIPTKETYRVDTLKIETTNYISPRSFNQVYLGANVEGNASYIQYGGSVAIKPKNSNIIYEVGYNINNQLGNNIMVGVKLPIFKF